MQIDIRFQRAVEADRIKAARRHKDDIEYKITAILRSSPVDLSEAVYAYTQNKKTELLERLCQ